MQSTPLRRRLVGIVVSVMSTPAATLGQMGIQIEPAAAHKTLQERCFHVIIKLDCKRYISNGELFVGDIIMSINGAPFTEWIDSNTEVKPAGAAVQLDLTVMACNPFRAIRGNSLAWTEIFDRMQPQSVALRRSFPIDDNIGIPTAYGFSVRDLVIQGTYFYFVFRNHCALQHQEIFCGDLIDEIVIGDTSIPTRDMDPLRLQDFLMEEQPFIELRIKATSDLRAMAMFDFIQELDPPYVVEPINESADNPMPPIQAGDESLERYQRFMDNKEAWSQQGLTTETQGL